MEQHLQKLVEHAEAKPSYNIIVTGNTSRLQTVFNPPLVFAGGPSCHYEMTLIKLETYYSFPNIKATNNCMTIPIGCYEIKAINKLLQHLMVEAGGKADKIILSPNNNSLIAYWMLIIKLTLQLRIACNEYWVSMQRSTNVDGTKVKIWWIL